MNNAITTLGAVALAVATGYVVAQTTPNPAGYTPARAMNPPSADAPAAPRSNIAPTAARPGMPTMQMPPDFATLDLADAGFVTQKDVAGNAWLSSNFATCDADRDMRVSRAEYETCSKQATP